jgi:hypothetical protein
MNDLNKHLAAIREGVADIGDEEQLRVYFTLALMIRKILVRKGRLVLRDDLLWHPTQEQLTSFIDFVVVKNQRRFVKKLAEEMTMTKERMDH